MRSPVFAETVFFHLHSILSALFTLLFFCEYVCVASTCRAGDTMCRSSAKWKCGVPPRTNEVSLPFHGPVIPIHSWRYPPQGFTIFALDAVVPGLVVRFRETPTPAQHIMELPAWGRNGGYLTLLRYHGAYTQLRPSPPLYLGPLWGLRMTMQCQHPSISTMRPSHYPSAEGGSSLGASKRRETRWGRTQGAGSMPVRRHPRGM